MTHLAVMVVRFGIGPVSVLEMVWLLIGLACLRDTSCMLLDARVQLAAALAPPVDPTFRELAVLDHRMATVAVAVQACFLAVGVVSALRPPPPAPVTDGDALAEAVMVACLMAAQLLNAVGGRVQRRASRRIDEIIRLGPPVVMPRPGGRRHYDPPAPDRGPR